MFDYVDFLYDTFGVRELAHAELATRPDNKLGTDEQWDHTEGVLRRALERIGLRVRRRARARARSTGRRSTSSWTTRSAARGRWGRSSSTGSSPSGSAAPTWAPTTASTRRTSSIARCSARSSASSGSCSSTTAATCPFWLAPVQVRVLPVGEAHLDAARRPRASAWLRYRVEVAEPSGDDRQADPGRRARQDPVHGRLRRPRESDESLAVRERGGEQSTLSLSELLARLDPCYPLTPEKQGRTVPHLPGHSGPRGFNRVETLTRKRPLHAAAFHVATTKRGGVSPTW